MVAIEFEVIAQYAKLPEGFKFHDWGNSMAIVPVPDENGSYITTQCCAIERICDGMLRIIEIKSLKQNATRGVVLLPIALFVAEIEKAINELS